MQAWKKLLLLPGKAEAGIGMGPKATPVPGRTSGGAPGSSSEGSWPFESQCLLILPLGLPAVQLVVHRRLSHHGCLSQPHMLPRPFRMRHCQQSDVLVR